MFLECNLKKRRDFYLKFNCFIRQNHILFLGFLNMFLWLLNLYKIKHAEFRNINHRGIKTYLWVGNPLEKKAVLYTWWLLQIWFVGNNEILKYRNNWITQEEIIQAGIMRGKYWNNERIIIPSVHNLTIFVQVLHFLSWYSSTSQKFAVQWLKGRGNP